MRTLLMQPNFQVMEAREEVEAADGAEQLGKLLSGVQERQRSLEARLSDAFKRRDLSGAAGLVAQLTYFVRLEEAIVAKM